MKALICEADDLTAAALERLLAERGFELVGRASSALEVVSMAEYLVPDVAIIRAELPMGSGVDATRELRALPDAPEVILVASSQGVTDVGLAAGAVGVAPWGDVDALDGLLTVSSEQASTGNRRSRQDRRDGQERRMEQDWSKVFSERRDGDERRKGPRRADEMGDPPPPDRSPS